MCGMGSRINYTSGADGLFMVKFSGDDVFVHIFKTSWKIPSGTKIPIWLKFDRGEPLTTTASGGSPEDGGIGGFVEFSIKPDFTKDFLGLFANANSMTLGFEQGSENPWAINMTGSREVAESFRKCSLELAQKPGSTQPYGNSGTTQPYGNKPARPSQPFGTQPTPKQQPRDDGGI
jgi:hypothetical protein